MGKITSLLTFPVVPDKFEKLEEVADYLDDLASAVYEAISAIEEEFNGKVEVINLLAKEITVSDTGVADTEFTVTHNLGRIPAYYLYNISKTGYVYDSRRVDWTVTQIFLKSNVANAVLRIIVLL